MTLSQFVTMVWDLGMKFLGVEIPLFEYEISFFQLLIFTTVGGILMGFFWTLVYSGQGGKE